MGHQHFLLKEHQRHNLIVVRVQPNHRLRKHVEQVAHLADNRRREPPGHVKDVENSHAVFVLHRGVHGSEAPPSTCREMAPRKPSFLHQPVGRVLNKKFQQILHTPPARNHGILDHEFYEPPSVCPVQTEPRSHRHALQQVLHSLAPPRVIHIVWSMLDESGAARCRRNAEMHADSCGFALGIARGALADWIYGVITLSTRVSHKKNQGKR